MDYEGFVWDDDDADEGAGINNITKAYSKVFKSIIDICNESINYCEKGNNGKEISEGINKIVSRASALVKISQFDKKIVGPTGKIFNPFGIDDSTNEEDDTEDENEYMSEEDFVKVINDIANGVNNLTMSDINRDTQELEKKMNESPKEFGDIGDVDW